VGGAYGAAARLGVNRTTLLRRMKKYGIYAKQYAYPQRLLKRCRKSLASSWKPHRTLQVVKSRSLNALKYYHPWWYIYRGDHYA